MKCEASKAPKAQTTLQEKSAEQAVEYIFMMHMSIHTHGYS